MYITSAGNSLIPQFEVYQTWKQNICKTNDFSTAFLPMNIYITILMQLQAILFQITPCFNIQIKSNYNIIHRKQKKTLSRAMPSYMGVYFNRRKLPKDFT